MTAISDINSFYIPKDDFDWEYYINQNDDIKKSGINSHETAYKHWIMYGCYENRPVKLIKSGKILKVKLKPTERFLQGDRQVVIGPLIPKQPPQPKVIDIGCKIAIMIHIFDMNSFSFFTSYLNYLSSLYNNNNFDIYINIVKENNLFKGDLQKIANDHIRSIINPNCSYFLSENRGGDIGGFLLLSKYIVESGVNYKYAIFAHSKSRLQWRKELCQTIFNIRFEHLHKLTNVGIIGCRKWIYTFDPQTQKEEYRRFRYHLVDLCEIYGVTCDKAWQFIAGTMFLAHIDIIKYIVEHRIDEVYYKLNKHDSIDINWLTIVTDELRKDPRGTGNDFQYRVKYGKALHSDYMIEHTFERIIGLVTDHLGLKIISQ